ncbi:hypothetical protein SGCZBJ_16830 [Caulobacter zeae]|uniref:AAA+ ATPase domain-containing protein n=1 Tax=Caulobacter zeae TaxID=2055137 RepID=A0A2N5DAD9_9CAUL|nr:ATP-binding protein [Caulobacter zeae]PLR23019.1 hypothetical protein SGCZBJ_16830 [Caulobacter zeae]
MTGSGAHEDPVLRLAVIAAARILLRRSDPALEAFARSLTSGPAGPLDAAPLAATVTEAADALFADLSQSSHPLGRIARGCGLSAFDLDLLGLALLPCLDDRGRQAIVDIAGQPRLPGGLALRLLLGDDPIPAPARAALWRGPLWRHGLLTLPDPFQPVTERLLDPGSTLLALLDGATPAQLPGGWTARPVDPSPLPDSLTATVEATASRLSASGGPLLHLAGDPERGKGVLAAAARRRKQALTVFDAPVVVGEPPWRDLALVALATDGAGALAVSSTSELAGPVDLPPAPIVLLASPRLHVRTSAADPPPTRVVLPPPDPLEQAEAWRAALPDLTTEEADILANQTWMTRADITALAARAGGMAGVAEARLAHAPPRPVRMATVTTSATSWSRLVVDETTGARLEELIQRYRLRVPVRFRWGMSYAPRGLIALLSGDSGVGKTLAAEAMATRLGLPMVRVDLSLVVSKYIGETEKNLAELFASAEGFAAMLFFDEADALFGKRTAVEDAHDRYANIEVNYLLQRLEAFEGLAVLATNAAQGVDSAFLRRFDLMLSMPRPGPGQRRRLWSAHLPPDRVDEGVDLDLVAERFDLTGGEIRNAALAAAYAAADGPGQITAELLSAAIRNEFAKKGRPAPSWSTGAH